MSWKQEARGWKREAGCLRPDEKFVWLPASCIKLKR